MKDIVFFTHFHSPYPLFAKIRSSRILGMENYLVIRIQSRHFGYCRYHIQQSLTPFFLGNPTWFLYISANKVVQWKKVFGAKLTRIWAPETRQEFVSMNRANPREEIKHVETCCGWQRNKMEGPWALMVLHSHFPALQILYLQSSEHMTQLMANI